jgi:NAD(P)H dehydrogenase (quinone)
MRILAVCCHPSGDSFHASLKSEILQRLEADGCETVVLDLYADGFDPVMREEEWKDQWNATTKSPVVERHVAELRSCEALLLIYPTWWYGMPAMLKGWLDRVWLPGVAFDIVDGVIQPHKLANIRHFAVVTTHGSPELFIRFAIGEPGRKQVVRGLRQHMARGCRVSWNAVYGIDTTKRAKLADWRTKTVARVARFLAN